MELWLVTTLRGSSQELAIEVDPHARVGELVRAIAEHLGVTDEGVGACIARTGACLDPEALVDGSGLRFGDELLLVGPDDRPPAIIPALTGTPRLRVVGGPDAGRTIDLDEGTTTVGRSRACTARIADPSLSREHLVIEVAGDQVTLRDAGSSAGTFVEGRRLHDHISALGVTVEAGSSLLRVDPVEAPERPRSQAVVDFNRPPRVARPSEEKLFKLKAAPTKPEKNRIPMASSLAPLALGLPMLFMPGSAQMIGMATVVLSPVLAVASFLEDRRSGTGRFDRERLAFYDDLKEISTRLRGAVTAEVAERRAAVPDPADLLDRCTELRPNLWERRGGDADFLAVGVGWTDLPAITKVEVPEDGDEEIRKEATEELARWSVARSVPVAVDVQRAGVVGLCGDPEALRGTAAWLLVQIAALHSPRDVVVAAALTVDEADALSWISWLPHVRSETSPLEGPHLAVGDDAASALFETVSAIVRGRRADQGNRLSSARKPAPALVLVVSERLKVPRTAITTILEDGAAASVYVIWLGEDGDHLPGECGAVIDARADLPTLRVTLPGTGMRLDQVIADRLDAALATRAARALSGVHDVTAGGVRGQIPRVVSLLELLDMPDPTSADVLERWASVTTGVDAPVGVSAAGPFQLDIRRDGPHALVGGTTGAGKSELLQTFVAALAVAHPPSHLTFVLIDYKGGAAFKDVVHLPHAVGFVTDLDGHLVSRALVSLNAELRWREHLLRDHGAKDLIEMEQRQPEAAPPSLVLIVDEFAALAKELPEFVDGVVDVAQRGRSLGVHLILATQRPAGAINDNVRANTNLRIALRMNDAADSDDVIGSTDAAMLPRSLPGRAFVRTGQSEMAEVQIAYAGGSTSGAARATGPAVVVMELVRGVAVRPRRRPTQSDEERPSDLQVLVEAARRAAVEAELPTPRPPWLPPLPAVLPLASVRDEPGGGRALLGLVDLPDSQSQTSWWWNPEEEGSLLVYGTGGSGKTTLLRTIASSLAEAYEPEDLHIYGLDFASRGLAPLEALPHVGSVVPGDDVERVQRLIRLIESEIVRRKRLFASAAASMYSEYVRRPDVERLPRMVVLFDGYSGFTSTFEKIDFGEWIERIPPLVSEGRALGLHLVIAADRRNAVGISLSSSVGSRVVLRMADADDYASIGLEGRVAKETALPPGRGFVGATIEMHVAIAGDDPSGDGQAAAIAALGASLAARYPHAAVPPIGSLPLEAGRDGFPIGPAEGSLFAVGQTTLGPVGVELADGNLLIAGPNRSGRSTALAAFVAGLRASTPTVELHLLAPRRSPLPDLEGWSSVARGAAACDERAAELADLVLDRDGTEPPLVIVIDDGTELADSPADGSLERIARQGRDVSVWVVGAAESTGALRSYGGWIPEVRKDRRALLLNPDADLDGDLVGVRLPRTNGGLPPGRGYLVTDGQIELVQVVR